MELPIYANTDIYLNPGPYSRKAIEVIGFSNSHTSTPPYAGKTCYLKSEGAPMSVFVNFFLFLSFFFVVDDMSVTDDNDDTLPVSQNVRSVSPYLYIFGHTARTYNGQRQIFLLSKNTQSLCVNGIRTHNDNVFVFYKRVQCLKTHIYGTRDECAKHHS